jgi:hypothetical protein
MCVKSQTCVNGCANAFRAEKKILKKVKKRPRRLRCSPHISMARLRRVVRRNPLTTPYSSNLDLTILKLYRIIHTQRCLNPQNERQWNREHTNQLTQRHQRARTNNVRMRRQGRDDVGGEEAGVDEVDLGLFV